MRPADRTSSVDGGDGGAARPADAAPFTPAALGSARSWRGRSRRRGGGLLRVLAAGALGSGAALLLAACLSERAATAPPDERDLCASPTATTVVIRDFAFEPAQMQVSAGETVTWINCDRESHTSTADAGEWRSGLLSPGTSFSRTMDAAGTFAYHCDPHPFMEGSVVVR